MNRIRYVLEASELRDYLDGQAHHARLDLPVNENIFNEMIECLYDFKVEWQGREPVGFLLSPIAFLQFKHQVQQSRLVHEPNVDVLRFEGIPVLCADISYRILPIIPEQFVVSYEWKRQQNQKGFI